MSLPSLTLNAWLRYDFIRRVLRRLPDVESVLEIGPGGGAMGARLARRYRYVGVEADAESAALAGARVGASGRGVVMTGDLSVLEPDAAFDVVCAFEVLEHIEDDVGALREWRGRLRPGGRVLLSVPAFQRRYGPWDRRVGHYRRYERAALEQALRTAGFADVRIWTFGFPLGFALERARNTIERRRGEMAGSMAERTAASGRTLQPPDGLAFLTRLATAPFRLLQRPFARTEWGTGFVAAARRRD